MIRSRRILNAPAVRILPIVMLLAVLLIGIRIYDIVIGGQALREQLLASNANAATEANGTEEEETETAAEEMEDDASEDADAKEEMMKNDDVFATRGDVKSSKPEESNVAQDREFSNIELDLLQSLTARREKLEVWEDEIALKGKLLKATEIRLEDKLEELKILQKQVQALIDKYEVQEEEEIKSLVKIYETMKPKSAAKIFNDLSMPVLFKVMEGMSERRAAPILAAMEPERARELTQQLAIQMKTKEAAKQAIATP